MMNTFFMTTAYGFAILPISAIILGILILDFKKNIADCHVQK